MEKTQQQLATGGSGAQRKVQQLPQLPQEQLHVLAQLLASQVQQDAKSQQADIEANVNAPVASAQLQRRPADAASFNQQIAAAATAESAHQARPTEQAVAALLQRLSAMQKEQQSQLMPQHEQQARLQGIEQQQEAGETVQLPSPGFGGPQPTPRPLPGGLAAAGGAGGRGSAAGTPQQQQQGDLPTHTWQPASTLLQSVRQQQQQLQQPLQGQQQQQQVPKLRMKPGKHLAAAAAREARQSGAAAASIAQWRRKPLNLAAARAASAGASRAGGSVVSPRDTLTRTASNPAQQQQQQLAAADAPRSEPAGSDQQQQPGHTGFYQRGGVELDTYQGSGRRLSTAAAQIPPFGPQRISQPQISHARYQADIGPEAVQEAQWEVEQAAEVTDVGMLHPTVMPAEMTTEITASDRGQASTGLDLLMDAAAAVLSPESPAVLRKQQLQQMQQRLLELRAQFLQQQQQQQLAAAESGPEPPPPQRQQQHGFEDLGGDELQEGRQRLQDLSSNLGAVISQLHTLLPQLQAGRGLRRSSDAAAAVAAAQQQEQQCGESWQGIYQPATLQETPEQIHPARLPAASSFPPQQPQGSPIAAPLAGFGGIPESRSTSNLAATSKASANAQQLQQMLQELQQLPDLPGIPTDGTSVSTHPDYAQQILAQPPPLHMAAFRRILSDILATHQEAKSLLQEAVNLGLLQQRRRQPSPSTSAAAAAAAAETAGDGVTGLEPPAKRQRSDTAAAAAPDSAAAAAAAKDQEPAVAVGAEGLEVTADETAAAAAAAEDANPTEAQPAEQQPPAKQQQQQQSADTAAEPAAQQPEPAVAGETAATLVAEGETAPPQQHGVGDVGHQQQPAGQAAQGLQEEQPEVQQQQQQAGKASSAPAAAAAEIPPKPEAPPVARAAAAAAAAEAPSADVLTDLTGRIATVMSKMQRHMHGLAFLAVPCAAELLSVRHTAASLVRQIATDPSGIESDITSNVITSAHLQPGISSTTANRLEVLRSLVTSLQQQLSVERATVADQRQELQQLQVQLSDVAQQQRDRARLVASAVTQLMGVVNSTSALTDYDRTSLVTAGAELLQSML